jgi:hypothetical protein
MYSAFKSAQNSMNEILLKLTEDTLKTSATSSTPGLDSLDNFRAGLAELRLQQDRQFATLSNAIQDLNRRIVEITTAHAREIATSALIPELQRPQVQSNFLSIIQPTNSVIDVDVEDADADAEEADAEAQEQIDADAEEEVVEEVEEEVVEEVEEEVEVEVEEEVVDADEEVVEEVIEEVEEEVVEEVEEEQEEEAEVEVEEWTYKGLSLFKDSNNMVYANVDGEVGDQIGIYNPVKGTVKKI